MAGFGRSIQSLSASHQKPSTYQRRDETPRKALLLRRVSLFVADDVGLGQTIEGSLIARDPRLRKMVREIVVACPPSISRTAMCCWSRHKPMIR